MGVGSSEPDWEAWQCFHTWVELGSTEVFIPFLEKLASSMCPNANRVARDFAQVISLIKAHALIHQQNRKIDDAGRIVATLSDYAAVYDLVESVLSKGVADTVSKEVRETVTAVAKLSTPGHEVSNAELAKALCLDDGTTSRRVKEACKLGYLVNLDANPGRASKLILDKALPEKPRVLPTPERLADALNSKVPDAA